VYGLEDIRVVHLELTARCNAACPQCSRNVHGGADNPNLPITELSLDDVTRFFPNDFIAQLECMYMCGVYGDAMVAKDTLEVFEHFRAHNKKIWLHLTTNGSGRTAEWWARLAKVVNLVTFSIDGLADTNAIYRRGTSWDRVMTAVRAYIGAGGRAKWEYLVFKHNEHQVDEARALATQLGFHEFTAKRTDRFLRAGRVAESAPVLRRDGEIDYYIEMPTGNEYHNAAVVQIGKGASDYRRYRDTTAIVCKAVKRRSLYVSAEGLVFPCCWTARLYSPTEPNGSGEMWRILEQLAGGKEAICAKHHSLREIVEGPLFQTQVPAGWATGPQRLAVCARQCGSHDLVASQYA
jgi:MoaA/NifB/PqqE/SkfB family radical SAM enzyme